MDRKGFTVAPTDCSPKQVHASVLGAGGGVAQLVDSFQVGDCASLGFDPEMNSRPTTRMLSPTPIIRPWIRRWT